MCVVGAFRFQVDIDTYICVLRFDLLLLNSDGSNTFDKDPKLRRDRSFSFHNAMVVKYF